MKVLVDTSVWVRFLSNKAPFAEHLNDLLLDGDVVGHQMVFGELLMGDVSGRLGLLSDYRYLPQLTTIAHEEVVDLVRFRRFHGRGVGWIDVNLLASAIVEGCELWTADPRLSTLANTIGLAYKPE